jgi:16S rRNA processing protein RimM
VDLVVGRVVRPHGVRGDLIVDVHTDEPQQRFAIGASVTARLRSGERCTLTVRTTRPHGQRLLIGFDAIIDRNAAEALRGAVLTVDSAALPPPSHPDEFYDHQIEGLSVVLPDGTLVGVVTEVVHGPGAELLVIAREGRPEALVPFVHDIVPTVDLDAQRMILTPPDGLLD